MAIPTFLAMTPGEIAKSGQLPPNICWMACRFSPDHDGLCGLPEKLPEGAFLILNDQAPIHGHDPARIAGELKRILSRLNCRGLLLDFQRPGIKEADDLVSFLPEALPCPVLVSHHYAGHHGCPVFLPPVPPSEDLRTYLSSWTGRDIWLEIGQDGEELRLTENGCAATLLPRFIPTEEGFEDKRLHCHYKAEVGEAVRFTLWRTREDLQALMEEAETLGVSGFMGLFQELGQFPAHLEKQHSHC